MKKHFITLTAIFLSVAFITACGQKETVEAVKEVALTTENKTTVSINNGTTTVEANVSTYAIDGLSTPESVVVRNGAIYVANIGGNPGESAGKGFITEYKNNTTKQLFLGLLDDPKGFAFLDDDTIIVSDHPNVKIIKISTGTVLATVAIDTPGFMNDLVLLDNKTALVSDTGKGLVYKVSIPANKASLSYVTVAGITENGINGLAFDKKTKTLYFVTSTFGGDATRGHIFQATLNADYTTASALTKWNTDQLGAGGLDGLALVNGKLVVSDWGVNGAKNAAHLYIFNADRSLALTVNGMISGVADIDVVNGIVYLPEFTQNKITSIDLKKYL